MKKFVIAIAFLMLIGFFVRHLSAENAPIHPQELADNAALRYWLAFAAMPQYSKEQQELVSANWRTAPIDEKVVVIVQQGEPCLDLLKRAAELQTCDWGLVWEGPKTLMPQLAKGRELAKLAALRMRYRCSQGDGTGAVTDAVDILTLARHLQSDGLLISVLVGQAVEQNVITAATTDLARLDGTSLQKLLASLDTLPPAKRTGEVLLAEKQYMLDWQIDQLKKSGVRAYEAMLKDAQGSGLPLSEKPTQEAVDQLVRQLEGSAALYVEWAKMATLPPEEYERKLKEAEEHLKKDNPFVPMFIPGAIAGRYNEGRAEATIAMFRAAIRIVLDNPKEVVVPLDAQKKPLFEYHKTENGFDLTSTAFFRGTHVKLSVLGK